MNSLERDRSAAVAEGDTQIPSDRLFVRTVNLPTITARQARAAVALQLDRLSPLPRDQVLFDLVQLSSDGGSARYAVGIVARQTMEDITQDLGEFAAFRGAAQVDGARVVFQFRNEAFVQERIARLASRAPNALVVLSAVILLLAAIDHRFDKDLDAAQLKIDALKHAALEADRLNVQHQSTWSDWTAALGDDTAAASLCALHRLAQTQQASSIALMETAGPMVRLTFARPPSASLRLELSQPDGLEWANDAAGPMRMLRVRAQACQ